MAAMLIALVAAGYAILYRWERRRPRPVIPVRLLQRPEIARSDAVVLCFAATLFSCVPYLPLYLQIGRGLGIGTCGTLLLPITLSIVAGSTATGHLVSRTGKVTIFPIIGLTSATLALIALGVTITFAPTPVVGHSPVAAVVEHVMEAGPTYVDRLSTQERTTISEQLGHTLRNVFFGLAAITATGALIATTVPKPKF